MSDVCFIREYYYVIEIFKELKMVILKVYDMKFELSILKEVCEICNLKYIFVILVVYFKYDVLLDIE